HPLRFPNSEGFHFPPSQNLTPPSQKYLVRPSSQGDRLRASGESPEVGPGTANLLAHRLPLGRGRAGEGAAFPGPARARNPRAERRSTSGRGQAGSGPPRPGGTLPPGPPRRGCRVSEGLRRPSPSPLESP
ncbi:LOW QUALITY PROTEIN: pH-response regulator protein palI/prr-5-like, partial [Neophocaena asiaeorientalis asiaeorientalis]|uniref:LOW QUALITY PROTEIN: pH-response regulator protein palI/prr-5-like n=1 Tax=Neophocaena asiaeorientalis asiaeorientalis TaxID=1706337 RepID=A0A341AZI4_NEOAA